MVQRDRRLKWVLAPPAREWVNTFRACHAGDTIMVRSLSKTSFLFTIKGSPINKHSQYNNIDPVLHCISTVCIYYYVAGLRSAAPSRLQLAPKFLNSKQFTDWVRPEDANIQCTYSIVYSLILYIIIINATTLSTVEQYHLSNPLSRLVFKHCKCRATVTFTLVALV